MKVCESGCRIVTAFLLLLLPLFARTEPDTLRLATHVKTFKERKQIPAAEYKLIRNQWLAWIDRRLLRGGTVESMNRELEEARLIAANLSFEDRLDNGQLGMVDPLSALTAGNGKDLVLVRWRFYRAAYCHVDDGVLVYHRDTHRRFARISAYQNDAYILQDVFVGQVDSNGHQLIATGWTGSNCTSNWTGKAMRIDIVGDDNTRNILTRSFEAISTGEKDVEAEIQGRVVTFRYRGALHNVDLLSGPAVSRFRINGDIATREAPFALTLAGVLNEWVHSDRQEAAQFSEPEAMLEREKVKKALGNSFFEWVGVSRCDGKPPVWELAVRPNESNRRFVFRISGARATELRVLAIVPNLTPTCTPIDISTGLDPIAVELPW